MLARSIHKDNDKPAYAPLEAPALLVCRVPGCARGRIIGHLMCHEHWFEVPPEVRAEVLRSFGAWLRGMENGWPYSAARLTAIISVLRLHGEDTVEQEERLRVIQNKLQLPSAADLDAVAAEQEIAAKTAVPEKDHEE
jgi:hypothetical protein